MFPERIPRFVKPWARMTIRLSEHLQAVALATSGRGGITLAVRLGMQTGRSCISIAKDTGIFLILVPLLPVFNL